MSQQARGEAKRLRRLKRKQDAGNGSVSNSISATSITVVGGGTLAAIAIALGVNALSPGGQNASGEDVVAAPTDSSQSPKPTASKTPDIFSYPTPGVSGSFKISITPSPSASPSGSQAVPSAVQGSYFAEGRYGAGYYSTAYDVAFSSPMFQAGSGFYYGESGYSEAIESPNGHYSQGGWKGSGFYESGYFDLSGQTGPTGRIELAGYYDLSGNTGSYDPSGYFDLSGSYGSYFGNYGGSWDGSGITFQYGTGAYYGVSGFSSAEHELRGSYYASGIAGAGYYANLFTGGYSRFSSDQWTFVDVEVGIGTYYGISGISAPISEPSGSYYISGFSGAGYYSTGYYACGYGYVSGATESNVYYGLIGRQTYYGFSPNSTPVAGPEGLYQRDGFGGSGYYEPIDSNYYEGNYGKGSFYGASGYGSPIAPPPGGYYISGFAGAGWYASSSCQEYYNYGTGSYCIYELVGEGTYYGVSGNSTPQSAPQSALGSYYSSGWTGAGYYASSSGDFMFGYKGAGTYYGTNGLGAPQAAPQGSYYATGYALAGYYSSGNYAWIVVNGNFPGISVTAGGGTYYGSSGYDVPYTLGPVGSFAVFGYAGSGYYATDYYTQVQIDNVVSYGRVGGGTYFGASGEVSINSPSGSFYFAGAYGSGYYSSGYTNFETETGEFINGVWARGYIGQGTYYGVSGADSPISPG